MACSLSLFFGAVTARITGEPVVRTISRMPIVLPEPGSATMTCQLRLSRAERNIAWNRRSKAVSTKMSFPKRGWVMAVDPLGMYERVRYEPDDQGLHLGRQVAVLDWQFFWPRRLLTVRALLWDGCPGVGDPIDGCAHLLESL